MDVLFHILLTPKTKDTDLLFWMITVSASVYIFTTYIFIHTHTHTHTHIERGIHRYLKMHVKKRNINVPIYP